MVRSVTEDRKRERASSLKWIAIAEMRVSPEAQRKFSPAHADALAADFDLELMGIPVISRREGVYWILDGQHRVAALKIVGLGNEILQCEVYEGLTESEEALMFLGRNDRRGISPFDSFRIALIAKRQPETEVNRIVVSEELRITQGGTKTQSIQAVGALLAVYEQAGSDGLARTLRLLRDSFDSENKAFAAPLLRGMSNVVLRYGQALQDEQVITRLQGVRGGAVGLARKAEALRMKLDRGVAECVAGAIVDTYNSGRTGKKLESWWA